MRTAMAEEKTSGFIEVLKNKQFLKLWLGQIVSYLGDRIAQMSTLAWLIAALGRSGTEMAPLTFFNLFPSFLFGQVAGAFADRFSRRHLMILSLLLRSGLIFFTALLIFWRNSLPLWTIYSMIFLLGLGTALFYPAKLAMIPNLVKPEELQAANALSSITGMTATLLGTYLAGALIARYSFSNNFIMNGCIYVVAATLIFLIKSSPQATITGAKGSTSNDLMRDFSTAIQYLRNHRRAWNLILLSIALSFLSSFFYISLSVVAVDHFQLGAAGLSRLLTMLGTGMLAGAFFSVALKKWMKPVHLLSASFLILFVTNLTAKAVRSYSMAWIWLLLIGISSSIITITIDTLLQRISPDRFRGKVFGFRSTLQNGVFLASLLGVSEILKLTSPFVVFKVLAFTSLGVAIFIFLAERNLFYLFQRSVFRFILRTLFPLEVEGGEYLRYQSKAILAGNHTGFLDAPVLIAASKEARPIPRGSIGIQLAPCGVDCEKSRGDPRCGRKRKRSDCASSRLA